METMRGGGAEKVLLDLLDSIDKNRYDITLLLVFKMGVHLDKLPKDIKIKFLYHGKPKGLRRLIEHFVPGRDWLYKRDARKIFSNYKWDSIISFMEGPTLKIHNTITDTAKRNISWVHVNLAVTHWTKYLYRNDLHEASDYKKMDRVAFVSQGALDAFANKFQVDNNKLEVINNIIPVEEIRRKAIEKKIEKPNKPVIVTVGRLVEQKRHDRILDAVKILHDKNIEFELWILGTGKLEKSLKEKVKKLKLEKMVRFFGFQTNPYPYINASDIFVLSSDTEGYPTVICEALSLGKPIVSTAITGSNELLEGNVGILTGLTPTDLAEGINSLINSPEKRKELSQKALDASQKFDKQKVLEKVYRIIDGE